MVVNLQLLESENNVNLFSLYAVVLHLEAHEKWLNSLSPTIFYSCKVDHHLLSCKTSLVFGGSLLKV